MGSGVAWIDYDGDGYPDLFFVNSRHWNTQERRQGKLPPLEPLPSEPPASCALYHNNHDGTFTDVTHQAGLDMPVFGMGVCVGDYDNDGHPDLYVTGLGRNYLFHNNGNGTFSEVAVNAGVQDGGWSASAAWVDVDRDGRLDLVVCHYVRWSPEKDIAFPRYGHRTYGTPGQYVGEPLALYHNDGNGHFHNIARQAGLLNRADGNPAQGKSLGVAVLDYDNDGWPDLAIANDTEPNYLFHNNGKGKFIEQGAVMGVAFPDNGTARGGMGIDASDYDRSGHESLVIGNFSNQMLALYHNEGETFRDVASATGVGQASLLSLSFGCLFFDYDNDGWPDLFIANGHVDDEVQEVQKEVEYAQRPLLFHNQRNGKFVSVGSQTGSDLMRKFVARGVACADYDLRGILDIALTTNNGPAVLLRNSGNNNHSLRLELEGTRSNRSAIGAVVEAAVEGGKQTYRVRSGSSYCSQSELPITVGMGKALHSDIAIRWPSGTVTALTGLKAGENYHVVEGRGVTRQSNLHRL